MGDVRNKNARRVAADGGEAADGGDARDICARVLSGTSKQTNAGRPRAQGIAGGMRWA